MQLDERPSGAPRKTKSSSWSINAQLKQWRQLDDFAMRSLCKKSFHQISDIKSADSCAEHDHNPVSRSIAESSMHSSERLVSDSRTAHFMSDKDSSDSGKFVVNRVPHPEFANFNPSERASEDEHNFVADRKSQSSMLESKQDHHLCMENPSAEVTRPPCPSRNPVRLNLRQMVSKSQFRRAPLTFSLPNKILTIFFINAILNHLYHHPSYLGTTSDKQDIQLQLTLLPKLVGVLATAPDINTCRSDSDCYEMQCYQGKCICPKDRPIEDKNLCLPLSVVGEMCTVNEQCLGNSACLDGSCSCGSETISIFNPSSKIFYCHPKRRLREECSHDAQCPNNSFCSTDKCLCLNGYGSSTVRADGIERAECLPKRCSVTSDCESEYHVCEDNRCICLADHFDPKIAECYKFGSTGGKLSANQTTDDKTSGQSHDRDSDSNRSFTSILKDLIRNSDKLWYVILIFVVLTVILLALVVMSLRKYFLGYCWTANKKEYEPNNKSPQRSGYFNKDSINNKSFRQKNGETDDDVNGDDNDDTAADRSNLMTTVNKNHGVALNNGNHTRLANNNRGLDANSENRYVKVDMRAAIDDEDRRQSYEQAESTDTRYQAHHQQLLNRPLATSNSTAV